MNTHRMLSHTLLCVSAGFIGIAAATLATASTYYVSSSSGSDANNGLSPEHAWQHLSTIYLKSISAGAFHPGDSILLRRGDQWDGQIHLRANGTVSSPITIGAYGEGSKPLLLGDAQQVPWEPLTGHPGIYTTDLGRGSILGALLQDGKNLRAIYPVGPLKTDEDMERFLARLQPGTVAGQFDGRLWIRMSDTQQPKERVRVFEYAGVSLSNSSYIFVENLDIERFSAGIDVEQSQNIAIRHNDIRLVLGIGIYLRSTDSDCRVESNTVSHAGNTALYVLKGTRNIFRDNWVSHVEKSILGIRTAGDRMGIGLQESSQTLVEDNYFSYSGGIDFYFEHDSTIRYNYLHRVSSAGAPHGTNLKVYGNIYNLSNASGGPGSTGVNAVATGPGIISVFNNTIFNASGFFLKGSSTKGGQVVFSNNIAASTVAGSTLAIFGPNVASNRNCFFTPGQPAFTYSQTSFHSLAAYREESSLDEGSVFADPQFVRTVPVMPLDFRIRATSGCNSPVPNSEPSELDATYDHDHVDSQTRIMGAFSETAAKPIGDFRVLCTSHCLNHSFDVPRGVYLIVIKFAAGTLGKASDITLLLNGTRVAADATSSPQSGSNHDFSRSFLVRSSGDSIFLESTSGIDSSMIAEVDILPFDQGHGEGSQAISW
jgi:parallel beta-helix repeat protein